MNAAFAHEHDAVTRGPSNATELSSSAAAGIGVVGPLVTGPLGPLVTPAVAATGRVDLTQAVPALLRRWGADGAGRFPCPIPGHTGMSMVDVPPQGEDPRGELRLLCCSGRWRSLGEVRASEAYGGDRKLSNPELATWTRRLAHECGTFEPLSILIPELPGDASAEAVVARLGFRLLIGLRWADGPHLAVAYSVRFCAAWCAITFRESRSALEELKDAGVIAQAGAAGRGNRIPVYVAGRPR